LPSIKYCCCYRHHQYGQRGERPRSEITFGASSKERGAPSKKNSASKKQRQSNDTSELIEHIESDASASSNDEPLPSTEVRIHGKTYYNLGAGGEEEEKEENVAYLGRRQRLQDYRDGHEAEVLLFPSLSTPFSPRNARRIE